MKLHFVKGLFIVLGFFVLSCEEAQTPEAVQQISPKVALAEVPFDLDVILRGEGKRTGTIKFRQVNDVDKVITLETCISGLEPNCHYLLQRAVDVTIDDNCTSTEWLTLGKGLDPQAISTDKKGNGTEKLFRSVAAVPTGATFDIHFRVIDANTLVVALSSDCYQYRVR